MLFLKSFVKLFFGEVCHVLDCSIKYIFSHRRWSQGRNGDGFSKDIDVLIVAGLCVSGGINNEE